MLGFRGRTGIVVLPSEILLEIFRIISDQEELEGLQSLSVSVSRLSAVCTRFRDIIHSNTIFWNRISASMHPDRVDACLERSRGNRLFIIDVQADTREDGPRGAEESSRFRSQVLPHHRRWGGLCLRYTGCDENELGAATEKFQGLCLPNLMELTILIEEAKDDDTPDSKVHMYKTWDAPLLREFLFLNIIPQALHNIRLESLTITIDIYDWRRPRDALATLMACLASQPSLERFSFNMIGFPKETGHLVLSRVTLPHLRELELGIEDSYEQHGLPYGRDDSGTSFAVPQILARLVTPTLESLQISFVITVEQSLTFDLTAILPSFNDYTNLKRLLVHISCTPELQDSYRFLTLPFKAIHSRMAGLNELQTSVHGARWIVDIPTNYCVKKLRELFKLPCACAKGSQDTICYVCNRLRWSGTMQVTLD